MKTNLKITTKKAQLIAMLQRAKGADIASICKKFEWQPHSARAALSGLRKSGYALTSERKAAGAPLQYRISEPQTEVAN